MGWVCDVHCHMQNSWCICWASIAIIRCAGRGATVQAAGRYINRTQWYHDYARQLPTKNRYPTYIKHTIPSWIFSRRLEQAAAGVSSLNFTSLPTAGWSIERCRHAHLRKVSPSSCDFATAYFAQRAVFRQDVMSFWSLSTPRSGVPSAISGHAVTSSLVLSGRQLGSLGHPGSSGYVTDLIQRVCAMSLWAFKV